MLSPSGRSRMWDAGADGYARGEGYAVVVLKTLTQAIANDDHIECIIRETGINQDGRSSGLTVPNSASQKSLIQSTYSRCGLDCRRKADRCQFFEAHGTGTLVGDPKEAEAIHDVFFPEDTANGSNAEDNVLHVGSVKTVLGHSEGAAGLASLLKASLAVQHGRIPPNMLFEHLNPAIEPFYQNLCIPTEPLPWPKLPCGVPKRSSINSFGFGGTNAHAIIESWEPGALAVDATLSKNLEVPRELKSPSGPFTLSANSEPALVRSIALLSEALGDSNSIDLVDLAWTLQSRRTEFRFRASFSATSKDELIAALKNFYEKVSETTHFSLTKAINVSREFPLRVLGIFTGQGAQWPRMGARLYEQSQLFRRSIQELDGSLRSLRDRPTWSLIDEMMSSTECSRVNLAEISQPVTTAIQIALVDLLKASRVSFSAVVGHSSGEIAAAYAAGYLKASDAIRIAYYRGVYSRNARSPDSDHGKMVAVGMTYEQALGFCDQSQFFGRIKVAASNSLSSSTLSGDADAVDEAKAILDKEKIFARILKVEKAYHSHHMEHCAVPYLESIRCCNIEPQRTSVDGQCNWYSSVYGPNGRSIDDINALRDRYWADNMLHTVLFSQAVGRAVREENCFDFVIEVGPHPSLKSAAIENLKALTGLDIPYYGVLKRGQDDMVSFANILGCLWKNFQSSTPVVDFNAYVRASCGTASREPRLVKGLPSYAWDRERPLFKESRKSKAWRMSDHPVHVLLGRPISFGNDQEMRWRNVLKLNELEWLRGHCFQNQILFPAAGYISMAFDASASIAANQPIKLLELHDLRFVRAITLEQKSSSGTEIVFVIRVVRRDPKSIDTEFSCYSGDLDATAQAMEYTNFIGRGTIVLGAPTRTALPSRSSARLPMTNVNIDRFYKAFSELGLDYSDDFRLKSIQRRLNLATVTGEPPRNSTLRLHPATLDAAFHGIFAAFSFPGDGRMWAPYLPTSVDRVRINMNRSLFDHVNATFVADCYVRQASTKIIRGDVDTYSAEDNHPQIQVEGFVCSTLAAPDSRNDRKLFARTVWQRDMSSGLEPNEAFKTPREDEELFEACERTSYYYLRQLVREISVEDIRSMERNFQYLMDWATTHVLPLAESGCHPTVRSEWSGDSYCTINDWKEKHSNQIYIQLIHSLGKNLPSIVRGSISALQILMENDSLNRLYKEGLGLPAANRCLGALAGQLCHRYPRMRVLEVGAGTGATTASALKYMGASFVSYTFTDISSGFFQNAQAIFAEHEDKMRYKVFDIEHSPADQGFEEYTFDLVIASNVLHATKSLSKTVKNCRKLLRPGGQLLLLEITSEILHAQFIMCALPGWWLGRDDGRIYHPTVTETQWDALLRDNGFSGVDYACKDVRGSPRWTFTVMASQAVDLRVKILREPLTMGHGAIQINNLAIVCGQSLSVDKIVLKFRQILDPFSINTAAVYQFEDIERDGLKPGSVVVCLADLEEPAFKHMNQERFSAIQLVFKYSSQVLWATRRCRADEPYANMIVGVGRSVVMENPLLRLHFVDIDGSAQDQVPIILSETLLRMIYLQRHEDEDILWSSETEVAFMNGKLYIPRVVPDETLNRRLNSERRVIEEKMSLSSTPVAVVNSDNSLILEEAVKTFNHHSEANMLEIKVHLSSTFSFSTADSEPIYLCIGSVLGSTRAVLAMSPTNSSRIKVPLDKVFKLTSGEGGSKFLQNLLAILICESLLAGLTGVIWVHNVLAPAAEILSQISESKEYDIFLSTSSPALSEKMTFIHSQTTERGLEVFVPSNLQRFVDMGAQDAGCSIGHLLLGLGHNIEFRQPSREANKTKTVSLCCTRSRLVEILRIESLNAASSLHTGKIFPGTTFGVNEMPSSSGTLDCNSVISWESLEPVPVRISPLSANGLFSNTKTYFLIGLASDLGMSLCEWMTRNGARHFAVASRRPKLNLELLKYLRRGGANIKIFSLDVADRAALHVVHRQIITSMPPISGVVNAAMVLRDKPFERISFQEFQTVLRPKVDGSENLDELFFNTKLEFFILFGSMSSIIGNPAQSNYGAANMFMTALVAQRRKRGVVGSILDIAMLIGLGYVTRSLDTDSVIESQMHKFSFLAISEPEFHLTFAEAVRCGKPEYGMDSELLTGLGNSTDSPWRHIPRFSHYFYKQQEAIEKRSQMQSKYTIQSQLREARNNQELVSILENAFCSNLGLMLQTPSDRIDRYIPLTALGIDSLVAVEIRSWFFKELAIDIPVLKLLSGASLAEISRDAATKLPKPLQDPTDGGNMTVRGEAFSESKLESALEEVLSPSNLKVATNDQRQGSPYKKSYLRFGDMSHAQSRLYFLHEYLEDKSTYNVGYIGKYHGELDILKLSEAVRTVCMQHESLRSSYFIHESASQPVQAVNPEPRVLFDHRRVENEMDVQAEIESLRTHVFDIQNGLLVKVVVLSQSAFISHIILLHHHIAFDGVSWLLFLRDLSRVGTGLKLNDRVPQSIDTSRKKQLACTETALRNVLTFWREMHQTPLEPLPLFSFSRSKSRRLLRRYDSQTFDVELAPDLARLIKQAASGLHITSFHFYLSTLAFFLSRCLGVGDFGIGIVDANRADPEEAETMGYFLNLLPLRFQLEASEPFDIVARRSANIALAALSNSAASFDTILDHLHVSRSGSHHPLFQVTLNYRNGYSSHSPFGDGAIEWVGGITARNPYDLAIDVTEISDRTILHFTTQKYMYGASDSGLLMKWYIRALEGLAQNPSLNLANCPISNGADLKYVLSLGRGDAVHIGWKGTLLHRIEEVASDYPDSLALKDGYGNTLTYAEMMARSIQISALLRSNDIAPGSYVAMLLSPMADHVCCLLAVMRLGLVWVPLDLRNPHKRISAMVSDCRPQAVVCDRTTEQQAYHLIQDRTKVLNLDLLALHDITVENASKLDQPAILLYTSGSTGMPKGVLLTQANILRHVYINTKTYGIRQEVVLQQSPLGFDLSLDQTFHALANGGTLIIVSKEMRGDPVRIADLMFREGVTYTIFVTSEYLSLLNYGYQSLEQCKTWRFAFSLGEKLTSQLRRRFQQLDLPGVQLINAYGPTEATIACARGIVPYRTEDDVASQSDSLWPMPNHSVAIMDEQMRPLPVGYPGEICIMGDGLALGYVNRPEETKYRFVETSLGLEYEGPIRLYRTGDRGRLLEDGSLNILGRIDGDTQVKIHGVRVELDEIANVIVKQAHMAVSDVAVSYRPEPDILAAFMVFNVQFIGNKTLFLEHLKRDLSLPAYMRPTVMIPVEQIPTNLNGKQDRAAIDKLPIQKVIENGDLSIDRLSPIELRLKEVWEDVLGGRVMSSPKIAATSDFFHVGGNSLLVIKLRSALRETFGVAVPLSELFQLSTLRNMATRLQGHLDDTPGLSIDWNAEVQALFKGLPLSQKLRSVDAESSLNVLLTGATGFLGSHVLQRLVDNDRVKHVHCVAIRRDSNGSPRHVSVKSDKIFEYSGDLAERHLGLSESQFEFLSHNTHLVVHNGAEVSYLKTYLSQRKVNVESTKILCEFAMPRSIPFHFVSTAAVASVTSQPTALSEVPVSAQPPPPNASDGYALSKWVSESLLEKVSSHHGLPVWIHRPSAIVGYGAPPLDLMTSVIKYSRELQAVPAMGNGSVEGLIDLVEVDDVSRALVAAALDPPRPSRDQAAIRFVHHCSEDKFLPGEFRKHMERSEQRHFGELPMLTWLDAALDKGLARPLYEFLASAVSNGKKVVFPVITKST